jgi:hypothetical protein
MKKTSIKHHLGRYSIYQKRATTINHAFASAIAPIDVFSEETVDKVLNELRCFKDGKIMCVYCGRSEAQTWDHLYALVKDNEPSGYGHKYGNLVPASKECNSLKRNLDWETANNLINARDSAQRAKVSRVIRAHLKKYPPKGKVTSGRKWDRIKKIRAQILALMKQADDIISAKETQPRRREGR